MSLFSPVAFVWTFRFADISQLLYPIKNVTVRYLELFPMRRFNGIEPIDWRDAEAELEASQKTVWNYRDALDLLDAEECDRIMLARCQLMAAYTSINTGSPLYSRKAFSDLEIKPEKMRRRMGKAGILDTPAAPAFPEFSHAQLIDLIYYGQEPTTAVIEVTISRAV